MGKTSIELDVEETEIAANFAAITAYNGPLRLTFIDTTLFREKKTAELFD